MNHPSDLSQFSMLNLFQMEVESQFEVLNHNLLTLEATPHQTEVLQALMRSAHSIKGAARIVDLEAIVSLAHVMEDCFVAAQSGEFTLQSQHIDTLLQAIDLFSQLAQIPETTIAAWLTEQSSFTQQLIDRISIIPITAKANEKPDISPIFSSIQPNAIPKPDLDRRVPLAKRNAPQNLDNLSNPDNLSNDALRFTNASYNTGATPINEPPEIDRSPVVRLSQDNLNRLMGLAGESLVEANWLQPFADSLLQLKRQQDKLAQLLDQFQSSVRQHPLSQQSTTYLEVAQQTANQCRQTLNDRLNELEGFARRSTHLSDRLYREVIASHMRPFSDLSQPFPRLVRDLGKQLGKSVKLEITGQSTPVDRGILEKLEAPLTQLIRNAIDHGIESPSDRLAAGKSPEGSLRLEATHRAGMLLLTVADDGRGIDLETLRQAIIHKQLSTPEMLAQMSETELLEFLYLPGFSTRSTVTEISGRGVGLDIVLRTVQEVGGTLKTIVHSNSGTQIQLQLPLTLSVIRALIVEVSGQPLALPLTRIDQIALIEQSTIAMAENRQYVQFNHQNVSLIPAHQILELEIGTVSPERLPTVLLSDRTHQYGCVVDRFLGEQDLVVRPLDSRLGKIKNISAAALLPDGSPIFILDVEDILQSIQHLIVNQTLTVIQQQQNAIEKQQKRILVVDDSITVREMERKLLQSRSYTVEVAVNGMDGWNALRTGQYDLLVTDVDMPRMNGIELISLLKQHPPLKDLPVIIVSYKDRQEDRLRGLEVGANYYLTKSSFHDDGLINAVRDLIGESDR
jgi:two-component system, chemotaxis family, sensor histidine kinase and response regulator WspE